MSLDRYKLNAKVKATLRNQNLWRKKSVSLLGVIEEMDIIANKVENTQLLCIQANSNHHQNIKAPLVPLTLK